MKHRKNKILVVDDEPDVVMMVQKRLEREGYEVVTAPDGKTGLKQAQRHRPQLILLDIIMPGNDGFGMLRALKKHRRTAEIPVILVTARSETDALREGKECGAVDYFIKPFEWDLLLAYIKRYLGEEHVSPSGGACAV
ncbi:MAG: response regulator [Candidatus Omnitrophica bacterium]|nr:response regulator [Candidatus Omnitrophota bacterium]